MTAVGMAPIEPGSRHWPSFGSSTPGYVPFSSSRRELSSAEESRPTISGGNGSNESLPPIGVLDLDRTEKEKTHSQTHATMATGVNASTTPLVSPTTSVYHGGHPLHHTYTPPRPPPGTEYTSPPISSRSVELGRERSPPSSHHTPTNQRQSLPSIHEALGSASVAATPHSIPPPTSAPNVGLGLTTEGPSGPRNPFASTVASTSFGQETKFRNQHFPHFTSQAEEQRPSQAPAHSEESRNPSILSLSSGKSPTQSTRTGGSSISNYSTGYDNSGAGTTSSMPSPTSYGQYPASYSYPQHGNASYQPPVYENRGENVPAWGLNPENTRRESSNLTPVPHQESAKRQLEAYDLEVSLNEIVDASGRVLNFSREHSVRAHRTNRSESIIGTLPPLTEIDDMLLLQRRSTDALARIRNVVVNQQHALAQQEAQQQTFRPENPYGGDRVPVYREEFKGGGFAGGDHKKRRGKPAPPGRCHSCNRAETPEWRRGPDGARTLCNACGLHYAKMTRKLGANKASALAGNLRPRGSTEPRPLQP